MFLEFCFNRMMSGQWALLGIRRNLELFYQFSCKKSGVSLPDLISFTALTFSFFIFAFIPKIIKTGCFTNLVFPLKHIRAIRTATACYCGCEGYICCSTRCGDEHKWWINCVRIWKTTAVSCCNLLPSNLSAALIKATKLYRTVCKRTALQSR